MSIRRLALADQVSWLETLAVTLEYMHADDLPVRDLCW